MQLEIILAELAKHKNTNKEEVLANFIQERLTASLSSYYKELDYSLSYLSQKNEVKLLKKLNN